MGQMLAVVLIALALLIAAAPPAAATFPGRNGDLLVTERSYSRYWDDASWLMRIDPITGALSRTQICAQSSRSTFPGPRCLSVGPPAASPDGSWVAFAVGDVIGEPPYPGPPPPWSIRVLPLGTGERRYVALDGGTFPGFVRWTPDFGFAVQAERHRVLLVGPDGSDCGTLAAPAVAPDVSSDGRLAFVRRGNVYVLEPGERPRRLTGNGGDQPSWSPHGKRIVFVRGGWLHTVPARGGRVRRLTRGFHPVWSPDGKQIAFFRPVSTGEHPSSEPTYLLVLNLATGRVRRATSEVMTEAGGIPPSGLDWQPAQ
jgi:Tol biopolymer transport system component